MFLVSDADAAAICAAYDQGGEFSAAVELRRRFPLVRGQRPCAAMRQSHRRLAALAEAHAKRARLIARLPAGCKGRR